MTFLSLRAIRKSFGPVRVLYGVDHYIEAGTGLALLGENGAGKSTLVRIVAGDLQADSGEIRLDGEPVRAGSVAESQRLGIRMISQEIADAPPMSVAENVCLGNWPGRAGIVSRRAMRARARRVLGELGAELDVDRPVSSLRLGERQIVEIARALGGDNSCLIFDEPTAALSDAEARRLFSLIGRLRSQGVAIVYITHRLDEVFQIADRVAVLRDGRMALNERTSETDGSAVVMAMVGHELATHERAAQRVADSAAAVATEAASGRGFRDVTLAVRAGQVLGIYGKLGSGVTEVAESLFGLRPLTAGHMELAGKAVRLHGPADAMRAGIGYLPPDRKEQALLTGRSVAENISVPSWRRLSAGGAILGRRAEADAYRRWQDALSIRSRNDPRQPIGTLSGGNQQKVILGRWLEFGAKVLVLVEPTRGVDVGARQEIYDAVGRLATQGSAVVVASSDYEDIVAVADEAVVMVGGSVAARFHPPSITIAALTRAAGATPDKGRPNNEQH